MPRARLRLIASPIPVPSRVSAAVARTWSDAAQPHVGDFAAHPPRLDARHVQRVVDQPQRVPLAARDASQRFLLAPRHGAVNPGLQELRIPADRVERHPELVTHHGAKVALGPVRCDRGRPAGWAASCTSWQPSPRGDGRGLPRCPHPVSDPRSLLEHAAQLERHLPDDGQPVADLSDIHPGGTVSEVQVVVLHHLIADAGNLIVDTGPGGARHTDRALDTSRAARRRCGAPHACCPPGLRRNGACA